MGTSVEPISWGCRNLDHPQRYCLRCGRLLLEMKFEGGEIGLASRKLGEDEAEGCPVEEPSVWKRWALPPGANALFLGPGMPEYPVLVEPDSPFHLLPGARARLFLRVPLSVVVRMEGPRGPLLAEFPTEELSQTWFGEIDNGELCYWLPTGAHREPGEEGDECGIQTPVTVWNDSVEVLQVTRLCLRVAGLEIYESGRGLWANETTVRYQGGESPSRVASQPGPPPDIEGATSVGEPREQGPANVVEKTFRSLRQWTFDILDVD